MITTLAILFSAYLIVLFWLLMTSDGRIATKALISLAFIVMTSGVFLSLSSFQGYPVEATPAADAEIYAGLVSYPGRNDPNGSIYIWVADRQVNAPWYAIFRNANESRAPRALRFDFSPQNEKRLQQALAGMKKGMRAKFKGKQGRGEGEGGHFADHSLPAIEQFDPLAELPKDQGDSQ